MLWIDVVLFLLIECFPLKSYMPVCVKEIILDLVHLYFQNMAKNNRSIAPTLPQFDTFPDSYETHPEPFPKANTDD